MRNVFKNISGLALLFLSLLLTSSLTTIAQNSLERPNIILFLIDDMGWTDTSVPFWKTKVDNNSYFQTPNMDSLAAQSLVFTQAYSSSPVCSPTRAAIMTGQNPMRTKITNWIPGEKQDEKSKYLLPLWNQQGLTPGDITLPSLLSDSGYTTIHIGKAHFGLQGSPGANPENLGFQKSYAGTHIGSPHTFFPPYVKEDKSWSIPDLKSYSDNGMYLTDAITALTLDVLDSLTKQSTAPFFINLAHYAVHTPIEAKEGDTERYRLQGKSETEAKYAAMVQNMDESLGAVMNKLQELKMDQNTVIIFASDNGGHIINAAGSPTKNLPVTGGKGFWYEGGYRVPFMIRMPGMGSQTINFPTISEDLFPTILAIAKTDVPENYVIDGENLFEILTEGKATSPRKKPLIWHYPHYWASPAIREEEQGIGPFTAIRRGNWKLIYTYDDQQAHLYDLSVDIGEKNNLIQQHQPIAKKLVDALVEQMKDMDAGRPIDRTTKQPVPYPHL
jgi:arylsulfatase A-like enzyme